MKTVRKSGSVHRVVMDDRRLPMHQIVNTVCISHKRVENILRNELGMSQISIRRVPRLFTPDQKLTRLILSQANLAIFEADQARFPDRFLTHNECWVHTSQTEITSQID